MPTQSYVQRRLKWNCRSMEMEKNRQFLDRTINERLFISNACSMLVRSFESLEFSRNSSTIPLDCRCFRFFLSFRYISSLFSSLLFRRFRSVAFFLPSMRFFFGISTIPEVSVELCSSWITEDDRSSRNTHLPRLWHTRDLTIRQFLLYNSCSIGKQIFRFPSLRTNVRQFQAESSSLLLFIPNLFKLSNTSLRRSLDDVHDKKKKKIPSPAIPNRDPSKKKKKKKRNSRLC